jgi:hypothetical protein
MEHPDQVDLDDAKPDCRVMVFEGMKGSQVARVVDEYVDA